MSQHVPVPGTPTEPPRRIAGVPRVVLWLAAGLAAVLLVAAAVGAYATAQPGYFTRYSGLRHNYDALQTSAHKGMACGQCHADQRGPVVYRAALVAEFYRSLFVKSSMPFFVTMKPPRREACLTCHSYDWSMDAKRTLKVPHPAHLRVITEPRNCVDCHRWTAHEETVQVKHTAMPFSIVCASFECHVGVKPARECKNCHHVLQESLGAWKDVHPQTVRANGPNGCLERCHTADQCRLCHTTGKMPVFATTILDPGVKAIEQQHVLADWVSKHGAMALADKSKCLQCHVSEDECKDCHSKRPAFHGSQASWLGQHQPLAKQNRQRCLTCHQEAWCDACHQQFKEMR